MGKFVRGDVVVIPFPFSDLSSSKRRPALVLADLKGSDVILCQITSQYVKDEYAIPLHISDFQDGNLNQESHIRPNRLFTADEAIVVYKAGTVHDGIFRSVIDRITHILTD